MNHFVSHHSYHSEALSQQKIFARCSLNRVWCASSRNSMWTEEADIRLFLQFKWQMVELICKMMSYIYREVSLVRSHWSSSFTIAPL